MLRFGAAVVFSHLSLILVLNHALTRFFLPELELVVISVDLVLLLLVFVPVLVEVVAVLITEPLSLDETLVALLVLLSLLVETLLLDDVRLRQAVPLTVLVLVFLVVVFKGIGDQERLLSPS